MEYRLIGISLFINLFTWISTSIFISLIALNMNQITSDFKPLFATYLNMARNNVFIVFSHIAEKVGKSGDIVEDALQEAPIIRALLNSKKPDEALKIKLLIEEHFPFIKQLLANSTNSNPADHAEILIRFINQLNSLRNFHTHYLHKPYDTDSDIISQLQFLFDCSRREVRKRFELKEEDVKHLVRKGIAKVNGERIVVEKENFPYAFVNKEQHFTVKGIAFFIATMLEKKYAYLFLKQLHGFKNSDTEQNRATLEAFCFYRIRIPQPSLQSNDTAEGYLLDVLEELKRCPANLYQHLSSIDKKRFSYGITPDDPAGVLPQAILKRSKDRFPHLALRYLEISKSLPGLQFYYDLGSFYFKSYEKTVDSEIRLRRLRKQMKGFGRSGDFNVNNMSSEWQQLVKYPHQLPEGYAEPYVAFTIPHYHIVNNQIGIWLGNKPEMPSLSPSISSHPPKAWLSIYELPALLYYHLLSKNRRDCPTASAVLSNHSKAIKMFFKDVGSGTITPVDSEALDLELQRRNLNRDQIPKPLLEYLLSRKPNRTINEKMENRLIKLIEETIFLINKLNVELERSKEKVGSKRYKPIRPGKIADFLARDMLRFQPAAEIKNGKATSTLFQVLQARLAFYGRDKELLENLYKECNLIGSNNPHPFLESLPITTNLVDYYRSYLNSRKAYLEKCLKKCLQGKVGSKDFHFLHLGEREKRAGADYYKGLAEKFIDMPLNLPRGLFMGEITKLLASSENAAVKNMLAQPRKNMAFIIKEYLKGVLNDDSQEFYYWKKTYRVFNKQQDERIPNSRDAMIERYFDDSQLSEEANKVKAKIEIKFADSEGLEAVEKDYKYYSVNEKQIRLTKTCDTVLFLLALDLFPSLDKSFFSELSLEQVKLSDILPDAEKGILSQLINVSLPVDGKFIFQNGIKLKSYGDFRRFLKDRRLLSLLPYFEEQSIERAKIEKELDDYDATRVEIHRLVLEFEERVILKNQVTYKDEQSPCVNHEEVLNSFWQNDPSNTDKDLMWNIRNKFSHNQYPDAQKFKDIIKSDSTDSTIAKKFLQIAKGYYKRALT